MEGVITLILATLALCRAAELKLDAGLSGSLYNKDMRTDLSSKIYLVEGVEVALRHKVLESEAAVIVIVEPLASRFKDFQFVSDSRTHCIVAKNAEEVFDEFFELLRDPSVAFMMQSACVISGHSERAYFEKVWDEWEAAKLQLQRAYGNRADSLIGFEQSLFNISFMESTPGINLLQGAFQNWPSIVIATGPSLTQSLSDLRELNDRALLISVDASLKILLKNGIVPHFVVSVERDHDVSSLFAGVDACKSHLVLFPITHPDTIRSYNGPKLLAYRDYAYYRFFEQQMPRGIISSSSSVAHMGLRLAAYLGSEKVCLVGQDLAYDPVDLRSHPDGIAVESLSHPKTWTSLKNELNQNKEDLLFVEGNLHQRVPTSSFYFSFIKEFSWEISRLKNLEVINCTKGGAKIPNLAWKPLREVTAHWRLQADPWELMGTRLSKFQKGQLDLSATLKHLDELVQRLSVLCLQAEDFQNISGEERTQGEEIITKLRHTQAEFMKDPYFVSFLLQNAGRDILRLENKWNLLSEDYGDSFSIRIQTLLEWFRWMLEVGQSVSRSLSKVVYGAPLPNSIDPARLEKKISL